MVKIPNKTRKSKIAIPTASTATQRLSKNVSTFKAGKKSDKPKTKGVSKPKFNITNKRTDMELPCCSSKQAEFTIAAAAAAAVAPTATAGFHNKSHKTDAKLSWCGAWTQNEQGKEILQVQVNGTTQSITTTTQITNANNANTAANVTATANTATTTAAERIVVDEVEMNSMFRSGVRYSDVLRSKNVSSSGSIKPNVPVFPPAAAATTTTMSPPQLLLNSNAPNEVVTDIDLTLFPELGQHKSCQPPNGTTPATTTNGVRLLQRAQQQTNSNDSPSQATLEHFRSAHIDGGSSGGGGTHVTHVTHVNNLNHESETQTTPNSNHEDNHEHATTTNEHASSSCKLCDVNSLWVQQALMNSAQPYRMDIAEFNFLRADQNYPRFLGQFEDENYLKLENLAWLGLKLALGGNFHNMHSNNGR